MNNIPSELKYAKSHEWVRDEGDGCVTVGITDHAQEQLGDLVFVELPQPGGQVRAGDECAVVESVKAASDVYSPVSGEILEVNTELADSPEAINSDAFGSGWMFKVRLDDPEELDSLLDADDYEELLEADD